jgi:hypothetical protein
VTFGLGGTKPVVKHKLGSVSFDQMGTIGSETFRGPLPAGRKAFVFRNDNDEQAVLTFYANVDGTGFVRSVYVPGEKTVCIPLGSDINFFFTAGGGSGRAMVLQ